MISFHDLAPDFRLTVHPPPALPAAVEARITAVWQAEVAAAPHLFDGPLLALTAHTPHRIDACALSYRYLLARRRDPGLRHAISVRPLAVTGLLSCADGIVLGLRAAHVASHAGQWEPAPAGGLDRADPAAQVLDELREELGLGARDVGTPRPLTLMETGSEGVFDIVYRLHTPLRGDDVRAAWTANATDEYRDIAIVRPADIGTFLRREQDRLMPGTAPLLRRYGTPA